MVFFELFKFHRIVFKARSDELRQKLGQPRVGLAEPAAVCDSVRDVGETLGRYRVVVFENALFKNLRMELRNAVYRVACRKAEVRHFDLAAG